MNKFSLSSQQISGDQLQSNGSSILSGESIEASLGEEMLFSAMLKNHQRVPQAYDFIVQVLDAQGNAVYLDWAESETLQRGEEIRISPKSWTPTTVGEHTVMMFIWGPSGSTGGSLEPLSSKVVIDNLIIRES